MKQAILISIVVGAAAGAGAAFLTGNVLSPAKSAPAAKSDDALSPGGPSGELTDQLALVTRENTKLAERITLLESRLLQSSTSVIERAPALAASVVPESLEQRIAALEHALGAGAGGTVKALPVAVDEILAANKEQERREEEQRRADRRLERTDERITELTESLGLNAGQARQMREILLEQSTKQEQLFSEMRDGGGDRGGNPREVFMAVRQEFDARVAQVLTPDQFTKYQEQNQGFGRRGFDFGGGGGGRDRGGERTGGDRPAEN